MCADFQRKASTVFHGENKEGKTLQRNTQYILALFLLLHWILRRWKTVISSISNTTAGPISSWDLPQELQAPVLKLCCLNVYFSIPYIEPQLPHFQFVTTGCSDSHCASRQEPSLVPGALPTAPRGCSPVPRHWLRPRVRVIRKHEGCRHMGSAPAPGQALLSCASKHILFSSARSPPLQDLPPPEEQASAFAIPLSCAITAGHCSR